MLSMRRVGLDVHARETTAVVLDAVSGEIVVQRIAGRPDRVVEWLATVEQPFQAVYEAGPTGYGLARRAAERGLDVIVCSPGHIRKHPGDRVKTDRRDAEHLARLLVAGALHTVRVPRLADEQLRDLVRSREDVRVDLMRCRHRISKFLLRRELYYPHAGQAWTGRHRDWLATLRFADDASEIVFQDALCAHDTMLARRDRLERALAELAEQSAWAQTIGRLRCLRGVDTLSAVGLLRRSVTSSASRTRRNSRASSASYRVRTRPVSAAGRARSRKQAPNTPGGCSSKQPGTTACRRGSAAPLSVASADTTHA